ncbi:MAG: hypothetical protein QM640_04275 [Niabella sp.]
MKRFLSILLITIFSFCILMVACKKDYNKSITDSESEDNVTAVAYQYNTATKKFSPQDSIVAQITSASGVKQVYVYLVRSGEPDSVVIVFFPPGGSENDVAMGVSASIFSKIDMSSTKGLKLMIKHRDNSYHQDSIKITPFTPPLPELQDFPASVLPDDNNIAHITGKAVSENGIKTIYIYDDAAGSFTKVDSITGLNNTISYDVDYNYTYRDKAGNLKIQVVDNFDLTAEAIIKIPVLPYNIYQDVTMGAQGTTTVTVTNNTFFASTGTTSGSCQLNDNEATMDFLFYTTSSGPTFYSPSNTANVATNFKCNGTGWTISNASVLKATKFRILIPGTATIDSLYANFNANNIPDLDDDGFFYGIAVPSSSTARSSSAATDFNTTTVYLIWVRIPNADDTFTNALIRAKEVVAASTAGLSTITFDIYVQK